MISDNFETDDKSHGKSVNKPQLPCSLDKIQFRYFYHLFIIVSIHVESMTFLPDMNDGGAVS